MRRIIIIGLSTILILSGCGKKEAVMESKVIPLKAGICTTFIIKDEGLVMVDAGIKNTEESYRKLFDKAGVNPADIQLIIITHGHSDHFANLDLMKKLTGGAPVLCHEEAVRYILEGNNPPIKARNKMGELLLKLNMGVLTDYVPVQPDIIINGEFDLKPYGVNGKIIPTPGHSDCSLSVLLDNGEALVGDTYVQSNPLYKNSPALACFSSDTEALFKSANDLLTRGIKIYYASHGGPFTAESIEKVMEKENGKRDS